MRSSKKSLRSSDKRKCSGLAVLANKWWCQPGQVTVEYHFCCLEAELLQSWVCHTATVRLLFRLLHFTHQSTFSANAGDKRMREVFVYVASPCVWGCGHDFIALQVENPRKTCFLLFFPSVNNQEGFNIINRSRP